MRTVLHPKKYLLWLGTIVLVAVVGAASFGYWYLEFRLDLPDHRKLTAISARERICSPENRVFTPFTEIHPLVRDALLAAEEPTFFTRPSANVYIETLGVLVRAALDPHFVMPHRQISTGVARCLVSSFAADRRWRASDWMIANIVIQNRIERDLRKETIFQALANETYFGAHAYGIADAATALFHKPLSEVTLDEAALLAGAIKGPDTIFHEDLATKRRDFVLKVMADSKFISTAEARAAMALPITLKMKATAK